MNELQIFAFGDSLVRTVQKDGEPWWIARDVCAVLGLGNPRTSLALLEEDEKDVHIMDTPGGPQEMTTISESGLYSLIFRSRKPEAKAFRRWVTHEVLPTLRRTGVYSMSRGNSPAERNGWSARSAERRPATGHLRTSQHISAGLRPGCEK